MKSDKYIKHIVYILVMFISAVGVMLLWNWLITDMFSAPTINYWQALGLYVLSNLLIKPGKEI